MTFKIIPLQSHDFLTLDEDANGKLTGIIRNHQEIPTEFLRGLDDVRTYQKNRFRRPDEIRMEVSVPTGVVDHWIRNGFNPYAPGVTIADIKKKLREENLDAFIVG